MGVLTVEEIVPGIVKVVLDPKTETGEFYQVCAPLVSILTYSGMAASIHGEPKGTPVRSSR